MRMLVILLALSTAAFAGTTVYYARQLSAERERAALAARTPATVMTSSSPARESASTATAAAPASPAPPKAAANQVAQGVMASAMFNGEPLSQERIKEMQAEHSRRLLAQLADPEQREELMAQYKMMMRMSYPRVAQVVGLSAEEYARFIELNAQQQLDAQEAHSRCTLDPNCDMRQMFRGGMDSRQQEVADLLGPERTQKYETYKNTMGEREAVSQLRTRLADSQRLGDDKAEQLIAALAAEREAMTRDALQSGNGVHGFGMGVGMVFAPDDSRPMEERYAAARQNSQRLRDRAAQYLNSEQQRVFNEMQDETLLGLRSALRQKNGATFSAVSVASPAP